MKIKEFMSTIEGLSPRTQLAYQQTLYQVQQTIEGDEPTPDDIKSFLEHYSPSSLQRHKAAISAYWDWRYPDKKWPFGKRQFRAVHRKLPDFDFLTPEVVRKIAEAGDKDDFMYVWTLYTLGCRISELMGIRYEDIMDEGVQVLSKGGEYRLKVALPDFIKPFRKYAKKKGLGLIFPEKYNFYYERIKTLGKKVGFPDVHPHLFRHARAVDLLDKGMESAYLQQFLGHSSYNTTAIYTQVRGGKLHEQLTKVEQGDTNNGKTTGKQRKLTGKARDEQ